MVDAFDVAYAVTAGREAAEALMLDTCTAKRGAGAPVTDMETGDVTYGGTPVYQGKCKVKPPQRANQPVEVGGATVTITPGRVDVPVDTVLKVGDVVVIDDSLLSPTLKGTVYRVTGPFDGSLVTAHRYPVEEA